MGNDEILKPFGEGVPERLRHRVCPNDHGGKAKPIITRYLFCGLYIPFEASAIFYAKNFSKNKNTSLIPLGKASLRETYSLYLAHECPVCGLISMWSFTKEEIEFLSSKNDIFGITWLYNPGEWREYAKDTDNEYMKKSIEETLETLKKIYEDK